jgi:LemA protein
MISSNSMVPAILLSGIAVFSLTSWIYVHNLFVRLRTDIETASADLDTELARRSDLIPNLVATVKGYTEHESDTLVKITQARTLVENATPHSKDSAEVNLSNHVKGLLLISEKYPELKASTEFLNLQTELTDTEDRIAAGRRFYNANIREYNKKVKVFPTSLYAKLFNFNVSSFLEISETESSAPMVTL